MDLEVLSSVPSPLILILGNPLSITFSDYSLSALQNISLGCCFFSLSPKKQHKSVDFIDISWGSKESKNIECEPYVILLSSIMIS